MNMNINMTDLTQEQFDKLSTLLGEIKEENEPKLWKPKDGEIYYMISANGDTLYDDYNRLSQIDKGRFSIGNYFKTSEEARKMVKFLKVKQELREIAAKDKPVKWGVVNNYHYYIYYDIDEKKVKVGRCVVTFLANEIYFSSRERAEEAIETIGKERLIKEYFMIE